LLDRDGRALVTTTAPPDSNLLRCKALQAGDLSFQIDRPPPVGGSVSFSTTPYSVVLASSARAYVVTPRGVPRGRVALSRDRVLALEFPTIGLQARTRLVPARYRDADQARDAIARACTYTACTLVGAALLLGGQAARPVSGIARCGPAITSWATAVFQSIEAWSAHALT
jgi:hypothetical protein